MEQAKHPGCQHSPWLALEANTAISPPFMFSPHCNKQNMRTWLTIETTTSYGFQVFSLCCQGRKICISHVCVSAPSSYPNNKLFFFLACLLSNHYIALDRLKTILKHYVRLVGSNINGTMFWQGLCTPSGSTTTVNTKWNTVLNHSSRQRQFSLWLPIVLFYLVIFKMPCLHWDHNFSFCLKLDAD